MKSLRCSTFFEKSHLRLDAIFQLIVEKKTPSTPILDERLWIRSRCVCWPLFDKYNRDWKTNTYIYLEVLVEWCKFTRALLQNRNINSTRTTMGLCWHRYSNEKMFYGGSRSAEHWNIIPHNTLAGKHSSSQINYFLHPSDTLRTTIHSDEWGGSANEPLDTSIIDSFFFSQVHTQNIQCLS